MNVSHLLRAPIMMADMNAPVKKASLEMVLKNAKTSTNVLTEAINATKIQNAQTQLEITAVLVIPDMRETGTTVKVKGCTKYTIG